ncbi:Hint domain-containing protein [Paracoccus sp. ME4]|uniref:Hint domain-containing protein n=1 Tax=Paracoccus sp. ME4 TaxID=3138066 RepID=UPI00398B4EAE
MTNTVTWMWIGRAPQINTTPGSPATAAEADALTGLRAVGPEQIRPVSLVGETRTIFTRETGWTQAYATTYNGSRVSDFSYRDPVDGSREISQITGFLRVDYRLTFPDNTTMDQEGVMIQMRNGDRFFRPSLDDLRDWRDITQLYSVEVLDATPLPVETYVARISFAPSIQDLIIICFAAGTMILTDQGPRPVENLRADDMVWTRDAGHQRLRWTGMRHLDAVDLAARPALRPIRIAAGALGAGQPEADLLVSPQHRVLIRSAIAQRMFGTDEVLAPACHLTGLPGIAVDETVDAVTYCHLMCEDHQVLSSNGALTESLYPGPQALRALGQAALDEIEAIFPGLTTRDDAATPARDLVRGAKVRRLVERHVAQARPLVG